MGTSLVGRVFRESKKAVKWCTNWVKGGPTELSHAKIDTYMSCPQKYEYQYIKKIKKFIPGPQLSFGSTIHRVLEELYKNHDIKTISEEDLLGLMDKMWEKPGYKDEDEENEYKERGRKALRTFLEDRRNEDTEVVHLEKWLRAIVVDNITIVGHVDRIDKSPEGKLIIYDYKTGERPMAVNELQKNLQANIYFLLSQKAMGKKFESFYFDYVEKGVKVPVPATKESLDETKKTIRQVQKDLTFKPFITKPGPLCSWCNYFEMCPEWEGETVRQYKDVRERGKMGLSYSKMSSFRNCPRSYHKVYIERIPSKPRSFFSIGLSIHQTFEDFYVYEGLRAEPTHSMLHKMYKKAWISAGYKDAAEEKKFFDEGTDMLNKYYQKYVAGGKWRKAHMVEPYFELPIGDGHVMIGFIDRVEKNDDGTYSLYDYKTDPKLRTQEEVDDDLQLTVYFWALKKKWGIELKDLTLDFMRFNERITTTRTDADVQKLVDMVNETAGAMLDAQKNATDEGLTGDDVVKYFPPKINKYCGGCDYLHDCPLKEEILNSDVIMHKDEAAEHHKEESA